MRLVLDGRIVIPRMTGAGRYVIELAHRLPQLASDLAVELLLRPVMRRTPVPGMLSDSGVKVHYVDVPVASVRQWFVIPLLLQGMRPNLYHYPFLDLPYVTFPSVVTIYDLNPLLDSAYFHNFSGPKRLAARWLIKSTVRRSKAVFAISQATCRLLQEHVPESAHKVRVIPLGVDPAAWCEKIDGDDIDAGSTVESGASWRSRLYALYVGVDRPHKNLLRLVRGFARFRAKEGWQEGVGPYLWLAGVGAGSAGLQAMISDMALRSDVRLDSELSERRLQVAYKGARVVVYLSTSEGFGLPILEAMAAGTPVLAGNASSLPEVGGDAVLYADPYDEVSISQALARVWDDPKLRSLLADRGRQRAAEFSWQATARATAEAYHDALRNPPHPHAIL